MDESRFASGALEKLVEAGYILKVRTMAEAKTPLGGDTPVIGKGALISKK